MFRTAVTIFIVSISFMLIALNIYALRQPSVQQEALGHLLFPAPLTQYYNSL